VSNDRELAALVGLLRIKEVRRSDVAEIVQEEGSAVEVLRKQLDSVELSLFDTDSQSTEVRLETAIDEAAAAIKAWRGVGMRLFGVLDPGYPVNLRSVYDRPPILFVRGELTDADTRSIAVVGTRKASPDALEAASAAAQGLTEAGYTVFSGLAAGVDTAAHRGAIDAGGRTVAVIGTGLRRSYPKANVELQQKLGQEFAVVSQFWPDQPPTRYTFPMRNAVMSGLSQATLVIEASNTSGARTQARLALEHGRPVFLMRRLLSHGWAQDYAERPGTYVVDDVSEVIERLDVLTSDAELLTA